MNTMTFKDKRKLKMKASKNKYEDAKRPKLISNAVSLKDKKKNIEIQRFNERRGK